MSMIGAPPAGLWDLEDVVRADAQPDHVRSDSMTSGPYCHVARPLQAQVIHEVAPGPAELHSSLGCERGVVAQEPCERLEGGHATGRRRGRRQERLELLVRVEASLLTAGELLIGFALAGLPLIGPVPELGSSGQDRSQVIREAIMTVWHDRQAQRLRTEAEAIAADEADRAEAREVLADMESLRAW